MICRNLSSETVAWFENQKKLAAQCASAKPEALTPLRPALLESLSKVVSRYEEDPVLAGEACEAWLKVLDTPENCVTIVAVDLLPPHCVRPDVSYIKARALTQRDEAGKPKPIPGVLFE